MKRQSEEVQNQVSSLENDITYHKANIVGRQLREFECLGCSETFSGRVQTTGVHRVECLWNYYVECPHCYHQSNLAKVLDKQCIGCGRNLTLISAND